MWVMIGDYRELVNLDMCLDLMVAQGRDTINVRKIPVFAVLAWFSKEDYTVLGRYATLKEAVDFLDVIADAVRYGQDYVEAWKDTADPLDYTADWEYTGDIDE